MRVTGKSGAVLWRWLVGVVLAGCVNATGIGDWLTAATRVDATSVYPVRTIQLIVPWAAGGGSDRVARILADGLQRRLGKPVIVVNRTGGSGAVGHTAGALAPPDGYSLTLVTFELGTMKTLGISGVTWRDYEPVAQVNSDAAAIHVRQDAPWKTLGEFLAEVRRRPGQLKMSGTATGGAWDLARAGLMLQAGLAVSNVLWTPAQGSAPALVELLGGHIDAVACSVPEAASQIAGGQVRVLGVMRPERLADYPELPTCREQGIDYVAAAWRGVMVPKGTPSAIIHRVSAAIAEVVESKGFKDLMLKNGFQIQFSDSAAFGTYVQAQEAQWRTVIQGAGFGGVGRNRDPGAFLMPTAVAALLVLGGFVELIQTRKRTAGTVDTVEGMRRVGSANSWRLLLGLGLYLTLMNWLGFVVSTIGFSTALGRFLGAAIWKAFGMGVLLALGVYGLFERLFHVPLP
jgi:tripartite-type tricarboxylate transporter receptor subunit TctC